MLQKITVLYNLPESDREDDLDTQKSAMGVADGLKKNYEIEILGINKDEIVKIKNLKSDFVFNLTEWAGNDYKYGVWVIEELEKAGLPYSGSDAWGWELTSNKEIMKEKMDENKILTPNYLILNNELGIMNNVLKFPVIIKPVSEHCGIGVSQRSLVNDEREMRGRVKEFVNFYKQPVLAEEFIEGRELQVTVLEKEGEPWVLPAAEVVFAKKPGWKPILSYEGKWVEGSDEYELSRMELANLKGDLRDEIGEIAKKCYVKLGGRDYPRVDMRMRGDEIFVLEINNNPGIDYDEQSGIGCSARAVNLSWEELLKHIVENAYKRFI